MRNGSALVVPLPWRSPPEELEVAAGEIHVFAFTLDVPASRIEVLGRMLSPDEVARAERFKLARDRRRFVVGRAGVRTILGHYLKREASQLGFQYGPSGKPVLAGEEATRSLRFNISGSHGLGLLAVQTGDDVGVDIERIRRMPNALSIAERSFTCREHAALRARQAEELDSAFFSLWTRREAIVKCLGRGLSHRADYYSVSPFPAEPAERILVETADGPRSQWVLALPEPAEGYVAALATEADSPQVRCYSWAGPQLNG